MPVLHEQGGEAQVSLVVAVEEERWREQGEREGDPRRCDYERGAVEAEERAEASLEGVAHRRRVTDSSTMVAG